MLNPMSRRVYSIWSNRFTSQQRLSRQPVHLFRRRTIPQHRHGQVLQPRRASIHTRWINKKMTKTMSPLVQLRLLLVQPERHESLSNGSTTIWNMLASEVWSSVRPCWFVFSCCFYWSSSGYIGKTGNPRKIFLIHTINRTAKLILKSNVIQWRHPMGNNRRNVFRNYSVICTVIVLNLRHHPFVSHPTEACHVWAVEIVTIWLLRSKRTIETKSVSRTRVRIVFSTITAMFIRPSLNLRHRHRQSTTKSIAWCCQEVNHPCPSLIKPPAILRFPRPLPYDRWRKISTIPVLKPIQPCIPVIWPRISTWITMAFPHRDRIVRDELFRRTIQRRIHSSIYLWRIWSIAMPYKCIQSSRRYSWPLPMIIKFNYLMHVWVNRTFFSSLK